ncbi:hypothetical protein E2C01_059464 [Portunus trituberculatus]|uniref:Uncharacterized protein n=1 Tax=Portunus trituberculatus TaxID=210409 RepID=A0A5B7GY91_PORTR|nr:hypothetical protein [Portunus trituberculatus]
MRACQAKSYFYSIAFVSGYVKQQERTKNTVRFSVYSTKRPSTGNQLKQGGEAAAGDGREWTGCGASLSHSVNPLTPRPLLTSEPKPALLFATSTSCFSFDLHTNIIMIKGHNAILNT